MGTSHLRLSFVIVCVALACLFSGCGRKAKPIEKPPPPPIEPAAAPTPVDRTAELEKQLAKLYTTTTPDGTDWKAYVSQVHRYNDQYYGVMIFGPPESEWEMALLRYNEADNNWDISATKIEHSEVGDFEYPDTARAAKQWNAPQDKLDAWIEQAETTMRKMMGQS